MSFEEAVERALKQLTLMNDSFMTVVFKDNIPATELVLKIILERDDLTVTSVRVQETLKNLRGHSLRLDILASDSKGKRYNIEFQNESSGASVQRARYHSALLDSYILFPGKNFMELPETYVIFITDKDVLGKGFPVYHVNRFIEEDNSIFGDGSHIIYVNGECRDATPLGKLMQDFHNDSPENMNYELLKQQVSFYKEQEEGKNMMCSIFEEYTESREKAALELGIEQGKAEGIAEGKAEGKAEGIAEGKAKGKAEGRAEGKVEGQRDIIISLLKTGVASPEQIALATSFSLSEVRAMATSLSA